MWRKGGEEMSRVPQKGQMGKRVMCERSPDQVKGVEGVRRKLDEFDLGDIFCSISSVMKREMESVVGKAPSAIQATMKEGMSVLVKAVEETMCRLSDRVKQEEEERKETVRKAVEGMEKLEVKVVEVERKVDKAILELEGRMKGVEGKVDGEIEKVKGLEDQVGPIKEDLDLVIDHEIKRRIGDSVSKMEGRVREARCALKVVNLDIGIITSNKADIVRRVLGEVRRKVSRNDVIGVNKVLRRTRVVVLGKETGNRKVEGRDVATVPILFQCVDRQDVMLLEGALRFAGLFPSFHWPDEIVEFVGELKKEVRKEASEKEWWIRVRPEEEDGKVRVRVDTKPRSGGRFRPKAIWACPPLSRGMWEMVDGLYDPIWAEGEGQ